MKCEFSGSVPKDPSNPESNEDKFVFSDDGARLSLCDGASESFDSKLWADLLAHKFITDTKVCPEWVDSVLLEYSDTHDFASMSWSKQAAYERGSFTTLIGLEYFKAHQAVEVVAVGDSIALLFDGNKFVSGWPFEDPEKFKERPTLFATVSGHNNFVGISGFWTKHGKTFHISGLSSPRLLCLTDAIGEWALKEALNDGSGIDELLSIQTAEQLSELVMRERSAKRMRVDDSTLIVLSFDHE